MSAPQTGPGTLWIVATPIGTLADLSERAQEILGRVDLVLAEDTRRARTLLSHHGLPTRGRLKSLHEHNEDQQVAKLVEMLMAGNSVALTSDAGTPVLSDPGFALVRAVRQAGLPLCSVPGPSSFTAALAASGQPPLPSTLCGFLPPRAGPRRRRITELAEVRWTLVVLLSPHRIKRELADMAEILGPDREATLLAEISKRHERSLLGSLAEISESDEVSNPRGEYVIVVGPSKIEVEQVIVSPEVAQAEYDRAISDGLTRPDAMRRAAQILGLKKRQIFDLLSGR